MVVAVVATSVEDLVLVQDQLLRSMRQFWQELRLDLRVRMWARLTLAVEVEVQMFLKFHEYPDPM